MMKKQLTIEELKQEFIKAKQDESLDCPVRIEDFLLPHLSESEKQELRVDLEQWIAGEEEFVKSVRSSIDLSELWRERIAPGLMNMLSSPEQDDLWETAIQILRSASGKVFKFMSVPWLEGPLTSEGVTLSAGGRIVPSTGKAEIYRLTKGPLAGTEMRLEDDRLLIDLKQRPPEGSQLRLVDRNGQTVKLPVIYELDTTGSIIYDLSGVSELPPFEIQLVTEEK